MDREISPSAGVRGVLWALHKPDVCGQHLLVDQCLAHYGIDNVSRYVGLIGTGYQIQVGGSTQ